MFLYTGPSESNASVLDQITVTNVSDQEALDDFLNSTDDDSSSGSLTPGNLNAVNHQTPGKSRRCLLKCDVAGVLKVPTHNGSNNKKNSTFLKNCLLSLMLHVSCHTLVAPAHSLALTSIHLPFLSF